MPLFPTENIVREPQRTPFTTAQITQHDVWLLRICSAKPPAHAAALFESLDKPALRPLPAERYQYGDWVTARVNIDYHVVADSHF